MGSTGKHTQSQNLPHHKERDNEVEKRTLNTHSVSIYAVTSLGHECLSWVLLYNAHNHKSFQSIRNKIEAERRTLNNHSASINAVTWLTHAWLGWALLDNALSQNLSVHKIRIRWRGEHQVPTVSLYTNTSLRYKWLCGALLDNAHHRKALSSTEKGIIRYRSEL